MDIIEKYVELRLIFDYLMPLFMLGGIAVIVTLMYLILWIPDYWKKLIDKYFKEEEYEEKKNNQH